MKYKQYYLVSYSITQYFPVLYEIMQYCGVFHRMLLVCKGGCTAPSKCKGDVLYHVILSGTGPSASASGSPNAIPNPSATASASTSFVYHYVVPYSNILYHSVSYSFIAVYHVMLCCIISSGIVDYYVVL